MLLPEKRRPLLKKLINSSGIIRTIEAHNAISASVVESFNQSDKNFHALWISSLTETASRGYADNEYLNMPSRMQTLTEVMSQSSLPIIFDADSGSFNEHLARTVTQLENQGVSAIVLEDKEGFKVNSLTEHDNPQHQISTEAFCQKIKTVCQTRRSDDFLMVARIETYTLGGKTADAIKRAQAYVQAGADIIMIHSKENTPDQVKDFAQNYQEKAPLMIVPSTYFKYSEDEAQKDGFKIVIYANHLLRAAHKAMIKCAEGILKNGSAEKIHPELSSVKDMLNLVK